MAEAEADSARTMFSSFKGDRRDVLPLDRGRSRAELPTVCFLPPP